MSWERLRASYDHVADVYLETFRHELDGKPRDRELLAAFAASVDDLVVEVGCGPGQIGAFVKERGRRVVGLDLSPAMAKLAADRLDGSASADLRALPLATGAVAGLLAFYTLIHIPRPELGAVVQELARVLRPGGRLLLSAHEGEGEHVADEFLGEPVPFVATLFRLEELVDACTAASLEVVRAERRPPYAIEGPTVRLYVEALRPARGR